ncbi:MAG: hypothetical protein AAF824_21115 [Bacteroidota bacterium]
MSVFFVGLLLLGLFACKRPPKGALSPEARTMLDSLALTGQNIEAKYMVLGDQMTILLAEALAKSSNKAVMNHLATFEDENALALRLLGKEIDVWLVHMSQEERIAFFFRLQNEAFTPKLTTLSASFKRRMRQQPENIEQFEKLYACLYWRK